MPKLRVRRESVPKAGSRAPVILARGRAELEAACAVGGRPRCGLALMDGLVAYDAGCLRENDSCGIHEVRAHLTRDRTA